MSAGVGLLALALAGCGAAEPVVGATPPGSTASRSEADGTSGEAPEKGAVGPKADATSPGVSGGAVSARTYVAFHSGMTYRQAQWERTAALIRQRAENTGVDGIEVELKGDEITVAGPPGAEETLKALGEPAELGFRPVVAVRSVGEDACRVRVAPASQPVTTCGKGNGAPTEYRLEPVAVAGTEVAKAQAAYDQQNSAGWMVNLTFTSVGGKRFADITAKLAQQAPPANQFAVVLDGVVLSAPSVQYAVPGGNAQISGGFTQESARKLAAQLTTGALPIDLNVSSVTRVPAH